MSRSEQPGASAPVPAVAWRRPAFTLLALALGIAAVLVGESGGAPLHALLVALLAGSSSFALSHATGSPGSARRDALLLAAMAGLLAWAVEPTMRVWQAPPTWAEALAFSPVGGGLALALLLGGNLASALARGRALGWREATALFLLPFLFTSLFLLSSAHLLADIGRAVGIGRWFGWYGEATFGRIVLLFLFNELTIVGGGWLIDGHWTRSWRLRALLLLSAVCASLTPQIASFGSGPLVAELPRLLLVVLLPLVAAAAMAGLWAQTFLLTGLMLDAIRGRRPAVDASMRHWREGAVKGAIYSFVFMALVQLAGLLQTPVLWPIVSAVPALTAVLAGTLLYPLGRTLIESFDGSAPFFHRLRNNAAERTGYVRGFVVGCGLALAILLDLPMRDAWFRFLLGALIGGLAYAGVDLLRDLRAVRAGERQHLQVWRLYALGALLGGITAGAVAWYLDTAQVAVIAAKLAAYATVHAPAPDYIVYPLFSKWGALSLGTGRGRRASALQRIALRRDQLVAGGTPVQHQPRLPDGTAAAKHRPDPRPVQRPGRDRPGRAGDPRPALGPVDGAGHLLVPAHGARPDLVRPGRCGADRRRHPQELDPVAGGLPRLEPAGLPGPARLRLVPGADLVRPYGPARRDPGQPVLRRRRPRRREGRALDRPFRPGTRACPTAYAASRPGRRCLIPFYIPRGAEWDQVWGEAERMQASAPSLLPPVGDVLIGYAVCIGATLLVVAIARWRARAAAPPTPARPAALPWSPDRRLTIGNGNYTLELTADGRSFARSHRVGDQPPELDLTRRSDDRLQLAGKFVYLREAGRGRPGGRWAGSPCAMPAPPSRSSSPRRSACGSPTTATACAPKPSSRSCPRRPSSSGGCG